MVNNKILNGPNYDKHKYFKCVLDIMKQFANATKEAIAMEDKFDYNQGVAHKRIEIKTFSEDMFRESPHAIALLGELSPQNPTN